MHVRIEVPNLIQVQYSVQSKAQSVQRRFAQRNTVLMGLLIDSLISSFTDSCVFYAYKDRTDNCI